MLMLADNILIDEDRWTEEKHGKLIIPPNEKQAFSRGTVVAVGPGPWFANGTRSVIEVKPGDHVLYFKQQAVDVTIDERPMHIIKEREVVSILEAGEYKDTTKTEGEADASH